MITQHRLKPTLVYHSWPLVKKLGLAISKNKAWEKYMVLPQLNSCDLLFEHL